MLNAALNPAGEAHRHEVALGDGSKMVGDDNSRAEPPFPAIMKPLSILVSVAQIEDMTTRLVEAMNPAVTFSEDMPTMRA